MPLTLHSQKLARALDVHHKHRAARRRKTDPARRLP